MRAEIENGKMKLFGEAKVKKSTIEVETSEFGKLVFDRATGKAKNGHASITNLADILADAPEEGAAKFVVALVRYGGYGEGKYEQILTMKVARNTARKFVGQITAVEDITPGGSYKVGGVYENDESYERLNGVFEDRSGLIERMANNLVYDAKRYMSNPIPEPDRYGEDRKGWTVPFSHRYRPFLTTSDIQAAIERERSDRDTSPEVMDYVEQLLLKGMTPTLVMVPAGKDVK
jgi:hypothetical protein